MEALVQYGVPALLGLVGGVVGSLVAPWVQWKVEKLREQAKSRREFLKDCREQLDANLDKREFRKGKLYGRLKPHLLPAAVAEVEDTTVTLVENGDEVEINPYVELMHGELARLEREWKLI